MTLSRDKILSSFKWNSLAVFIIAILVFVQTYILLRYLSKEDFGVMAIINATFLYLRSINTISVTSSLLYIDDIENNRRKLSSIFWMLFVLNAILAIGMFFSSDYIGGLYSSDEIAFGLKWFSCLFLFDFVTAIYRTLLQKKMAFKILFNVFVIAKLVSFGCAVILAVLGFGYKALLFSVLLYSFLEMIICLRYGAMSFIPLRYFKAEEIKGVLNFGAYETGAKLIGEIRKQIDIFLIGKIFGLEILGVYNVLKMLLIKVYKFVNPLLSTVTMPWMSQEKGNLELSRSIFFNQNKILALIIAPIYVSLFVFAPLIVEEYFGIGFIEYIGLFQILVIAYFIGNPISLSGSLVVAHGKVKEVFYWNIVCILVYLTAIYLLQSLGLIGFAYALVIFFTFMIISFNYYIVQKTLGTSWTTYYKSYFIEVGLGVFLGAIYMMLLSSCSFSTSILIVLLASFFIVYYSIYFWYNKDILKRGMIKNVVRELW